MNITLNGTSQQLTPADELDSRFRGNDKGNSYGINLSDIVSTFCKQSKHVLTELNGAIVPPDQWAQTNLQDGDVLELITFVGGG